MSSTSKGWLGSKRRVICSHCGKESRLDNLPRHTAKVHGDNAPVKYSVIEPKDNVISFFKAKEKEPSDIADNCGGVENIEDESEGDNPLHDLPYTEIYQNENEPRPGGS